MLELPRNRYFNIATKKMFNKRLVWYYCHVIYFIKTDWQMLANRLICSNTFLLFALSMKCCSLTDWGNDTEKAEHIIAKMSKSESGQKLSLFRWRTRCHRPRSRLRTTERSSTTPFRGRSTAKTLKVCSIMNIIIISYTAFVQDFVKP